MKGKYKIKEIELLPADELLNLPLEYQMTLPHNKLEELLEYSKNRYETVNEMYNSGTLIPFLLEENKKNNVIPNQTKYRKWHIYIMLGLNTIFNNKNDKLYQINPDLYDYIRSKLIEKTFHEILLLLIAELNQRAKKEKNVKSDLSENMAKSICMYLHAKNLLDTKESTTFSVDANLGYWDNLSLNGYSVRADKYSRLVRKIKESFKSDNYLEKFSDFYNSRDDFISINNKLMYLLNYYDKNDGLERDNYLWLSINPYFENTISRYFPLYTYYCFNTISTPTMNSTNKKDNLRKKRNYTNGVLKHLKYLITNTRRPTTPSLNEILFDFEHNEKIYCFIRYNFKDFYEDLEINSNRESDLEEIDMLTTCNRVAFEDRYPLQFYYSLNTDIVKELIDNTFSRKEIKNFYITNGDCYDEKKMNILESILNLSKFNINMRYVQKLIDDTSNTTNSKNYLEIIDIINNFIKNKYPKCINLTAECMNYLDSLDNFFDDEQDNLFELILGISNNIPDLDITNYFIKETCRNIDNLSMKYKEQETVNNPILSKLLYGTVDEINDIMVSKDSIHSEFANIRNNDKDYIYLLLLATYITK